MRLRMVLVMAALSGALGCKEDIPRPPDEVDDAGFFEPSDVSPPDATPAVVPDVMPAPTCGTGGQACCPGNVCLGGGCCMNGMCVANGTPCRADATCLDGSCGGCGAVSPNPQDCCEARLCTASRTTCLGPGTGQCQPCGAASQSCCGDGFCQSDFTCDKSGGSQGLCVPK